MGAAVGCCVSWAVGGGDGEGDVALRIEPVANEELNDATPGREERGVEADVGRGEGADVDTGVGSH